jgi:hypothetical protein
VIKYIEAKRKKGCSEQHIHEKLEKLELKVCLSFAWRVDRHSQKLQFMHIESLHPAWRDARASFQLRRSDHIPCPGPSFVSMKKRSSANWSGSRLQWHRRAQSLLRHDRPRHSIIHLLQHQLVLHQCHLLHQYYRLLIRHHLSTQANKIIVHPATVRHCPYSLSIVRTRSLTSKCLSRRQAIHRISMGFSIHGLF